MLWSEDTPISMKTVTQSPIIEMANWGSDSEPDKFCVTGAKVSAMKRGIMFRSGGLPGVTRGRRR